MNWLLFAKDLTSYYDSKPSTRNKEKFGGDLQSPFHLILNILHQTQEELSLLGCLGVTTSQGRETLRWGISERNYFRRSCFFPGKEFIFLWTQEKLISIHFCLLDSDFIFCYSSSHCFLRLTDSILDRKLTSKNIRWISQKCDERIFQCLGANF